MNYLMVSGHNKKHLSKIEEIDGIIMLNLEDGVPKNKKKEALENIINLLNNRMSKKIIIRVNELCNGGLEEIEVLSKFDVYFRIPKIKSINELQDVFSKTDKEIHLSIETKEAFFNLREFKHSQITTFYIGILDLFDELKLSHDLIFLQNPMVEKILIDFSLNSLYLNKIAIGFVYQQYKNLDGFKKWCEFQKNIGLKGVGCITPAQLKIANDVFNENKNNIDMSIEIVQRFEKEGPFSINGLYVDEPIYKNHLNKIESYFCNCK